MYSNNVGIFDKLVESLYDIKLELQLMIIDDAAILLNIITHIFYARGSIKRTTCDIVEENWQRSTPSFHVIHDPYSSCLPETYVWLKYC